MEPALDFNARKCPPEIQDLPNGRSRLAPPVGGCMRFSEEGASRRGASTSRLGWCLAFFARNTSNFSSKLLETPLGTRDTR
jgi:hypothetical protein